MAVNDMCRFCKGNLRIGGKISNSKRLFEMENMRSTDARRTLVRLGLVIDNTPLRSVRVCRKCFVWSKKFELDVDKFCEWKKQEAPEEAATSADKRDRDTPVKTPKKSRRSTEPPARTSVAEASGGSVCPVLPTVRHVASQTDSPETKPETRPQTRTVGTQLSIKTLQNAFRSTGTQVRVPSRDCGVCTLTFPLDSPILFLQPTVVKRPSKRPRLSLKEEEEGPSESSLSVAAHEPENST